MDHLPATARELVEVIGLQATVDLVKAFGGDDVKIPAVVNGTSRMWAALKEAVGSAAAAKLVNRFADTAVYVPTCQGALRRFRNLEIQRRYDAGETLDTLRREHKTTRSNIYRLLKKPL